MKVLKFEADWCGPCKAYTPIFEQVTGDLQLETEIHDVDKATDMVEHFNIRSVPTTLVVDDNEKELGRVSGMIQASDLKKFIEEVDEL